MKLSLVSLLLGGLLSAPSFAVTRRQNQLQELLAVVTSYDSPPAEGMLRVLHSEVESIFKIETVRIVWRDHREVDGHEAFDHLVVARFTGHCEMLIEGESDRRRTTLGFTHVSDGKVIPFLQIDCDRLAALLGPTHVTEPIARRQLLFGRALGRVLCHEIYHVIAETQAHNTRGLAKPGLTPQELMSDWMGFEKSDLDRMQEKIEESMPEINSR